MYEGGDRMRLVFEQAGFRMENLRTLSLRPEEVSGVLQGCDFGVAFFEPRLLWDACPLKVGEYLAAGLPVVVNAGIELSERIVRETGCGVILENEEEPGLRQAARALLSLLESDPVALRASCRASAEKHLSLQTALSQLEAVYRELGAGVAPL
jgi:glycosyltransferase involved in cell wall biosynthesis